MRNRISVPRAFVITSEAHQMFLNYNKLGERLDGMTRDLDVENINQLIETSKSIRELFISSKIPDSLEREITDSYNRMFVSIEAKEVGGAALDFIRAGRDHVSVSLRPSPFESKGSSFPGIHDPFLNVGGVRNLTDYLKLCWASMYSPKSLYYRKKKNLENSRVMGVMVQRMVNCEKSGNVSFLNNRIIIEGSWGLGTSLSEGNVSPDRYVLDPAEGMVTEKMIGKKLYMYTRDPVSGKTKKEPVLKDRVSSQLLDEEEIRKIFHTFRRVHEIFGNQISMDWGMERGKVHVFQIRPISWEHHDDEVDGEIKGYGVSPGEANGVSRMLENLNDFDSVSSEDIIITKSMNSDLSLLMGRVGGIVSEFGGLGSNVSFVSREFGVPCTAGIDMNSIERGRRIILNGSSGTVSFPSESGVPDSGTEGYEIVESGAPTATEIFMNLDFRKDFDLDREFDGVALEASGLFGDNNPLLLLRNNPEEFDGTLERIESVAGKVFPKMVWYRLLSPGGEDERNPMLGCRGIRRVLENRELFRREIEFVKKAHENGSKNIGILLPFVSSIRELRIMKDVIPSYIKIGIEVSVPSAALEMESFVNEGVDFVMINLPELSKITLGIDPENPRVSSLYSESSRAVMRLIEMITDACRGQADVSVRIGNYDQRLVERLVNSGVNSISLDPEFVDAGKNEVSRLERKFLIERFRTRDSNPSSSFP